MNCHHDHTDLGIHIATYLHQQGVTQNIMHEQVAGTLPAVYIGPMDDQPDHSISIIGPWQNNDTSPHSTTVRFMISTRSEPWNITQLAETTQHLFHTLHQPNPFPLTATHHVMFCERVVSDPPVQDQNRRWIRVDTYSARIHNPTS